MNRIESALNTRSADFLANREHNLALAAALRQQQDAVRHQRPDRDMQRLARQDKLFVRDRLRQLLDPGTPFLELSTLAGNMEYDGEVPGAGVVTGIGIVSGREVMVNASDASVKGGAWYPLSVKKIVRATDIAVENRLPMVTCATAPEAFCPCRPNCLPTATSPGASSETSRSSRRWGFPKSPSCSGIAPPAARTCPRCRTTA